jgi:hypothetical protein
MKTSMLAGCCCLGMTLAAAAGADEPAKPDAAAPQGVKALAPFMRAMSIKGTIPAGSMGPDSKELTTSGTMTCKPLFGASGYECEMADQLGTGKKAMQWKARFVIGWDGVSKLYKGVMVQNMGSVLALDGRIDGQKLVWETPNPVNEGEKDFKDRLTFDLGELKFTDEHQTVGTTDWKMFESGALKLSAK